MKGPEMPNWTFTVHQDGMLVSSGSAPDEGQCRREAAHYAWVYEQDGPVKVRVRKPNTRKPSI